VDRGRPSSRLIWDRPQGWVAAHPCCPRYESSPESDNVRIALVGVRCLAGRVSMDLHLMRRQLTNGDADEWGVPLRR